MKRREFIAAALAPAAAGADGWNAGSVRHILPAATHERIYLKISFERPVPKPPTLRVNGRFAKASQTDSRGRFWAFDMDGLKPSASYDLTLEDSGRKRMCDPWPLRTMPHPEERPERFRLMIYTCAGGNDVQRLPDSDAPYWVSAAQRRKLFGAGIAQKPDAMVAIGDHVYWDQRFARGAGSPGGSALQRSVMGGDFVREIPVMGTPNEERLRRAVDPQIATLYGTLFRSIPTHFVQDDHDYFENDEAIPDAGISFPPDDFMTRLARATQQMYYPEFLPDASRPAGLPGASAADRGTGLAECFGTLRFGRLAELLIYDCRRYQTLKGPHATLVPENVEAWLLARMQSSLAAHVVNVPSMPVGWTAGKWGEWYADVLQDDGRIGTGKAKYYWQEGWKRQHDRLLQACSAMERIPLFMSGDLHALAHGAIHENGKQDLRRNPVHTVLTGPVSTGPRGWPSSARGTPPMVANGMGIEEDLKPLENNGFTIADFYSDRVEFMQFRWKLGEPEGLLDDLRPFHRFTLRRAV